MKIDEFFEKAKKKHKGLNRDLLRRVAKRLRSLRHEKHYDQSNWAEENECGTAYCVAGWVCVIEGAKPNKLAAFERSAPGMPTMKAATNLLGLTEEQADVLFDANGDWPAGFGGRFEDAIENGTERPSRIAADFLDAIADGRVKL